MRNYNKEELEQWILVENQTYEEIGRRLGVTGAAIKKAAKRLGIELPVRRYKNDSEHFNKKDKPKRYCIVCGKPLVVRSVSLHTSTMSQLESGRMVNGTER